MARRRLQENRSAIRHQVVSGGVLGIDKHDRVWVSAVCGRIQRFTTEGEYLGGFGSEGTKPGEFFAPHGLAFDSRGHMYIVDAFSHRVQKFAVE